MQFLRIVILCIVCAVIYGILHDLVTAHICVEYFTIGHPRSVDTNSPILLALVWGVVATWWVGLGIGLLLALCCRVGRWPKVTDIELLPRLGVLLAVMAILAACAGVVGRMLASSGRVWLVGRIAQRVPQDRHIDFLTALWAHSASYAVGALGGIVLCLFVLRARAKLATVEPSDHQP